jgi:probable rRNA maturation factor
MDGAASRIINADYELRPPLRTAPRTMILLDPALGPDFALRAPSATRARSSQRGSHLGSRLPALRTLARFLATAQAAVRLRGQVTVLLTTDAAIRKLNRQFRGKNKPTDVLSFPADTLVQNQEKGDLAISVPTALRQAVEQGHPLATEIKVLILHGLLHLAGYDHETDQGQMARRERRLRARLGLPLGLIERTGLSHPQGSSGKGSRIPTLSPERRRKDKARSSRAGARQTEP